MDHVCLHNIWKIYMYVYISDKSGWPRVRDVREMSGKKECATYTG